MKLKYQMEVMNIDDFPIAVPVDCGDEFRGVLHMNGTTQDILKCLESDVTEEEIVASLQQEYDATEEQLRHSVRKVVDILRENKLLTE